MSIKLWNCLHDAEIVGIHGDVPGDIQFTIEIEHLQGRFGGSGKGFVVTLTGCDLMEYRWEMKPDEVRNFPEELESGGEGIVSASVDGDRIRVWCTNGWLWLRYQDFSLELDTGEKIDLADLQLKAREYWDEFGKRTYHCFIVRRSKGSQIVRLRSA